MQKEEDLPGNCPFLEIGECCPYGIACRYSGTHRETAVSATSTVSNIKLSETNSLNKDVQRHLWKNTFKFPMADAQLKLLGLKVFSLTSVTSLFGSQNYFFGLVLYSI